jgi:hypothetical protein
MAEWRFKLIDKGDKFVNPIQDEFFTTASIGGLAAALVRETIQNSLDARDRNSEKPVHVRFEFSGQENRLPLEAFQSLFDSLFPHLVAEGTGLSDIPNFNLPAPFLLIEDFNTKGLNGSPEEYGLITTGSSDEHNFYFFWRNIGRSGKSDEDRGRWGLGKTVFPASSRINTFFGLTCRSEDGRKLLMGQSVLKTHQMGEGQIFHPYGDFGTFLENEPNFALPVEDSEVDQFEIWSGSKRGEQTGLSVLVPWPHSDLSPDGIISAVLREFFEPILRENLTVDIVAPSDGERSEVQVVVNKGSIYNILSTAKLAEDPDDAKNQRKSLHFLFSLCAHAISLPPESHVTLLQPGFRYVPQWRWENLLNDDLNQKLEQVSNEFEQGKLAAFRVPVKVSPKGEEEKYGWFNVYLQRNQEINEPVIHFIRDGLVISGVGATRRSGLMALVMVNDPILSRFLGDAENPAHTEWKKEAGHFRGKYIGGEKALSFVVRSVEMLFTKLVKPVAGLDWEALKDVFFIPKDGLNSSGTGKGNIGNESGSGNNIGNGNGGGESEGDAGNEDSPVPPEVESKPKPFEILKAPGGFRVRGTGEGELPDLLIIKCAYDVGGNSLKAYIPWDFDLAERPISIDSAGCTTKQSLNELLINPLEFDFDVKVTGFDENRDLFIKDPE